jgi:SOS response regulatory protein OraA/RecX
MRVEWTDLSDSELRAKLEQRGVRPGDAERAAQRREQPAWAEMIERVLKP